MRGVDLRVGSKSRPDQAIRIEVMKLLMDNMEEELKREVSMLETRDLNKKGDHFMIFFVALLRGIDGFMVNVSGFRHYTGRVREENLDHVVIPVMGRFKGGTGSRHHLQAIVNKTASKFKVRWWMERLNDEFTRQGHRNGNTCCDEEVNLDQVSQYQGTFVNF